MASSPWPHPQDVVSAAVTALTHDMARAYFERNTDDVFSVDGRLRAVTEVDPQAQRDDPVRAEVLRDYQPVQDALMMLEGWVRDTQREVSMTDALNGGRSLVAAHAPAPVRDEVLAAFDRFITGEAELVSQSSTGLKGATGAHLYAAVTAAIIGGLHPIVRGPARVMLETQIRKARAVSQGIPVEQAASYVPEQRAWQTLVAAVPRLADMTGPRHAGTRKAVLSTIQLYLLDHAAPEPQEIEDLVDRRLKQFLAEMDAWKPDSGNHASRAEPAGGLTPEQLASRRSAERARRQAKRKGGRPTPAANVPAKQRQNEADLAKPAPQPAQPVSAGGGAELQMHALLFLLNYLAHVDSRLESGVPPVFSPRRDDENADAYELRRRAGRGLKEVQAAAGSWPELCAEELRFIPARDAGLVSTHILGVGLAWARAAGFEPTADGYRDGATPLLRDMCPADRLDRAVEVLTVICGEMVTGTTPSIAQTAELSPVETIHVAAAMTASLYSVPECVPDRAAATLQLCDRAQASLSEA